ncbi:MAG: hypothetical protein KKH41_01995 [Candidatus Thermoplasmatota archaeon]|nr:hypothetical protein [Euryarchaeota archaeon]MBU4031285.1 hypothetical protein [Candidatus Thermoplasmatota archaeon]MBU4143564.1 hypothetical protein [Candidatus Thermoplasmatota archaeon]MBU4591333.1 hypothetical protein [Candidatus Thermoplasmatota archaeon]
MSKKKGSSSSSHSGNGNAATLYEWISEGYFVNPLIEAVQSGDQKEIDAAFQRYAECIDRLQNVREKLTSLGFNEKHASYQEVSDKFNDPTQVDDLESLVLELEQGPKFKELKAELASLNIKGFEEDANRIIAMFDDGTDPDTLENEIKKLKKRIKEKFFEEAFEEVAVPVAEKPKSSAEMIFLLHRDGTLLSVKSKNPPTGLDKKLMSRMVMAIKEQMGRAFKEGEHVHTLAYEGHTIILEDSVHVYAAVVIVGEAKPVMYRVILKALQIMERKLSAQFDTWNGDRNSLENLEKYVTAIFQALDKVK